MSMSKKLYKRITTLHKEGLSRTMTIKLFITMAKNPDDVAEAIEEFYWTQHPPTEEELNAFLPERSEFMKKVHEINYGGKIDDSTP